MSPGRALARAAVVGTALLCCALGTAGCPGSHVMKPVGQAAPARRPGSAPSAAVSSAASADPYADVPMATGPRLLPVPPAQRTHWTAPATSLPEAMVSATAALFGLGLADPRTLPYHEIDLATGSVWEGKGPIVRTRGWLLPALGDGPRHAVAYNGLVYPVVSVGAPADLGADVRALVAAHAEERLQWAREHPGEPFSRASGIATAELGSVSHRSLAIGKVALLLRLGEVKHAEALWAEWSAGRPTGSVAEDPLGPLATSWLWAAFDRGLTAHMRGDDDLALASLAELPELGQKLEKLGDERGLPRPDGVAADGTPLPRYGFAQSAAKLRSDQLRRHAAGKRSTDLASVLALPVAERVPQLVALLDDVAARQWGQPGGVNLTDDPIVQALVAVGNDAVEPLITVLEVDQRLTRSVHFWRDFSHHRSILGVHEAAYAALAAILQRSFFEASSTGDSLSAHGEPGRAEVVKQIRDYWQKWRGVSIEERWFRLLADDSVSPDEWLDAARQMVQPSNVVAQPGSSGSSSTTTTTTGAPSAAASGSMRGEPLRAKSSPTVTELLTRRITALGADVPRSCELALALGAWEPAAARPALREQAARAITASITSPGRTRFGECIAAITLARARSKDIEALGDYGRWVERTTPAGGEPWLARRYFEPMQEFPKDGRIVVASRVLFNERSPWLPLVPLEPAAGRSGLELADLLETPLLRVVGFREHVLRALSDTREAGHCHVRPDGASEVALKAGWTSTTSVAGDDPKRPLPGSSEPVRVADYYAFRLAAQPGAPAFQPCWPLAERNAAIATLRQFVSAYR